jgi:hypothetical protein
MTIRDELHSRINRLSDEQLAEAAALLERLSSADEPLPSERAGSWVELADVLRAHGSTLDRRAVEVAHDTPGTPLPLAMEALNDYIGARPGLVADLLDNPPDAEADPIGAALVDDQRRQIAGSTKREWCDLTSQQKAEAVAAGARRWR